MVNFAKRISSILLMAAFFLPLSQCTVLEGHSPNSHSVPYDVAAFSSYDWPSIGSLVALTLFFWPAFLQLISVIRPQRRNDSVWPIVMEACMCLLTGAGISWLTFMGNAVRYGAWVAYTATMIYFSALAVELMLWRRLKVAGRESLYSGKAT